MLKPQRGKNIDEFVSVQTITSHQQGYVESKYYNRAGKKVGPDQIGLLTSDRMKNLFDVCTDFTKVRY